MQPPPPSPPPRRPRPASHAATLAQQRNPSPNASLHTLRTHRDNLTTTLTNSAPPWSTFAPAITSLHRALHATQSASHLRNTLATLPPTSHPNNNHYPHTRDYPARLSETLTKANQLTANIALLASVRSFLTLAEGVRHLDTANASVLAQATALRRALVAAKHPAMSALPALESHRKLLVDRHATLLAQLNASLLRSVYAPPPHTASSCDGDGSANDQHHQHNDIPLSTRTLPATPIPTPPSPQAPTTADLVRAADTLAGDGHAASVIISAASASLSAAIRHAILAEADQPTRTLPTLATTASFTAQNVQSLPSSSSNPAPLTTTTGFAHIFAVHLSQSNRAACQALFDRVRGYVTAVLTRLASLASSLTDQQTDLQNALRSVWRVAQTLLVAFVHALLALPSSSSAFLLDADPYPDQTHPSAALSLLPSVNRKNNTVHGTSRTYAWAFEQGPNSHDHFVTLIANMPALSPSIYNLETIFAPLQQFILSSSRLLHSCGQTQKITASPLPVPVTAREAVERQDEMTLTAFLSQAVDIFVKTVRQDVKSHMDNSFGNRAGTLLQPPSTHTPRSSQLTGASSFVLPALPQTQILLDIIASCLSLCAAVPSVATRLGEIINSDVIKPFSERAIYALDLAESWTDAGPLLTEIRKAAYPSEEALNIDENDMDKIAKSFANDLKRSQAWNTRALRTIRKRPDLTTKSLERIYDKTSHMARQKPVTLLDDSEWKAVVRLVANAKIVIAELESCTRAEEEWKPNRVTSHSSVLSQESASNLKLRVARCDRGGARSGNQRAMLEAIGRTRSGCRMLREEVVERGIALLHTEVVLRCFSEVIHTLVFEANRATTTKTNLENEKDDGVTEGGKNNGTSGLSKPSSIFKASNLQLSDMERSSEDTSVAMFEYDEFGDRIASDSATDLEMEEYGFPNTSGLEGNEWKTQRCGDEVVPNALSEADRVVIGRGREFGMELRAKDESIKWNLSVREREFIFCQSDGGVAAGIRMSGEIVGKEDRDVASGARLFLDAAGSSGAETFGWPVSESGYSVVEGASASAAECRTLLYGAGLL